MESEWFNVGRTLGGDVGLRGARRRMSRTRSKRQNLRGANGESPSRIAEPQTGPGRREIILEMFAQPFDLLLGRKTYDIFAAHWPYVGADDPIGPLFDRVTKYVATRNPNLQFGWQNSQNLGADVVDAVRRLKNENGPDLLTQGSTQLLHTLFKHELVDELHLSIFPVVLGAGKRLFVDGISPGALKLVSSRVSGSGVTVNKYVRDGNIRTGNFQMEPPTEAELRRRRNLT
jgi:dihydrofolate reductase